MMSAEIEKILSKAQLYCILNGLSYDKLLTQEIRFRCDAIIFLQSTGVEPNGLCNDLLTQPYVTLEVKKGIGKWIFEQTEYTDKYLSINKQKKSFEYTEIDIKALDEKIDNPEKEVRCPRCGNLLLFKEIGNSCEVKCASSNCLKGSIRGI